MTGSYVRETVNFVTDRTPLRACVLECLLLKTKFSTLVLTHQLFYTPLTFGS